MNPFFYPFKGGIEHRMHDTARLLAQRGHDVTVLTGRLPDTEEEEITEDGYRIVRLKSRLIDVYNPPIISSKGVLEALESMDADVVNYNYRWAPSYNKDLAKYDGKKVFTYHNTWGEGMGWQAKLSEINDDRFRKTLETFDHIICVSEFVQKDLMARGIPAERTSMIPSCLNSFPETSSEEGDFILSLGRLVKTKGLKYLIEAMKDVDCELHICGKGPEYKKLSRQISDNGLGDRVILRGYVSEQEKQRLMSTCKTFVVPSLWESLGLATVELMSYGRPVVSSNVGGLPDTVGEGGITVPPRDPKALAGAINRLLSDDGLRHEMGTKAREHAETYNWKYHIGTLEDVLEAVRNKRE